MLLAYSRRDISRPDSQPHHVEAGKLPPCKTHRGREKVSPARCLHCRAPSTPEQAAHLHISAVHDVLRFRSVYKQWCPCLHLHGYLQAEHTQVLQGQNKGVSSACLVLTLAHRQTVVKHPASLMLPQSLACISFS